MTSTVAPEGTTAVLPPRVPAARGRRRDRVANDVGDPRRVRQRRRVRRSRPRRVRPTPVKFGTGGISGAPYPLARPDAPVTWNVDQSQVIASDQQPEQNATVKMLRWPYYLAPSVIKSFESKYHCTVEETEFEDMDKGLAKMNAGQGDFDLLIGMNVWALGRSIAAKLIRPLNLDYIPNLAANNWDTFQSPFYDVGSHYSTPYSVWSTGIFWRNDQVTQDIAGMANPYDIFWNGAPVDKTHLLANAQDVLAMAMFREGITDVNSVDATAVTTAKDAIQQVVAADERLVRPRRLHGPARRTGLAPPVVVGQRQRRVRLPEGEPSEPGGQPVRTSGRWRSACRATSTTTCSWSSTRARTRCSRTCW